MEVKMKSTETKTTMTTTKTEEADEKKKTKEQVIGHSLGQEPEEVTRQGHDPKMEFLRQIPDEDADEETRRDDSLKNSETEMMMKMQDDKIFGEKPEMIKKEDQKENFRQPPEKDKKEDQKESFRQDPEEKRQENNNNNNNMNKTTKPRVWDCGSTLYDSFELNSFKRQLDSAISAASARTMSMPHLPDRRLPPSVEEGVPPLQPPKSSGKKSSNKFSRSLQKLLKSVFKPKQQHSSSAPSSPAFKASHGGDVDRYYVVFDKSESLTTIPELAETEVGPEISSLVRKTASERFTAARLVGISCA